MATIFDSLPIARNGAALEERRMERFFPADQATEDTLPHLAQVAAPAASAHHVWRNAAGRVYLLPGCSRARRRANQCHHAVFGMESS